MRPALQLIGEILLGARERGSDIRAVRSIRRLRWAVVAVLLLALTAVALRNTNARATPDSAPTPDQTPTTDKTIVFQYQPRRQDASLTIYKGLLDTLPRSTSVLIGVEQGKDEHDLRSLLGVDRIDARKVEFIRTGPGLGPWVRDRYIPFTRGEERCLYVPNGRFVHPMERASLQMPPALERRDEGLKLVRSDLDLEGGDLLLSKSAVFVGAPTVFEHTRGDARREAAFRRTMEAMFDRRLEVVGAVAEAYPYDHIDMFLSVVDERTLLLGDPRLAIAGLTRERASNADVLLDGEFGRFLRSRQLAFAAVYDRLAADLSKRGFLVERLPILHGEPMTDGRRGTLLNWNNALVDRAARHAYVPTYGLESLDTEAHATWRRLGFEPIPIDSRAAIVRGGSVRCLTVMLERP